MRSLDLQTDARVHDVDRIGLLLPHLEVLRLTNSFVTSFRQLGTGLRHLRVLALLRAGLTDCDGISALEQVEELYLGFNEISDVSALSLLEHCRVLDLEGNQLAGLRSVAHLAPLTTLQHLNMAMNPVAKLPHYRRAVVGYLPALQVLDEEGVGEADRLPLSKAELATAAAAGGGKGPAPSLHVDAYALADAAASPRLSAIGQLYEPGGILSPARAGASAAPSTPPPTVTVSDAEDEEDLMVADVVRASVHRALSDPRSPEAVKLRAVAGEETPTAFNVVMSRLSRPRSAEPSPGRLRRWSDAGLGRGEGDRHALQQHAWSAREGALSSSDPAAEARHSASTHALPRRPRTAGALRPSTLQARWHAFCAAADGGVAARERGGGAAFHAAFDSAFGVLASARDSAQQHSGSGVAHSGASALTHGTGQALVGNVARALRRKAAAAPVQGLHSADGTVDDNRLDAALASVRARASAPSRSADPASSGRPSRSRDQLLALAGLSPGTPSGSAQSVEESSRDDTPSLLELLDSARDAPATPAPRPVQLLAHRAPPPRRDSPAAPSPAQAPAPSPAPAPASADSPACGPAVAASDEELIHLLQQRPKHVPQLRSRDSFRKFFAGMPCVRMERLLRLAFGALEEGDRDAKVAKRMALLRGCLAGEAGSALQ